MSEEKTTVVEETKDTAVAEKKNGWLKNFIWLMMGVIIGIVLGFAIFTASMGSVAKDLSNTQTSQVEAESEVEVGDAGDGISTYLFEHKTLTGEDAQAVKEKINSTLEYIKTHDTYVQIQTGEASYESYLYNDTGECFAQSSDASYHAIFRNDGKTIKYSDANAAIAFGKDTEVISIVQSAVNAIENGVEGVQLFEMIPASEDTDYIEYRIDLVGEDAVKACYQMHDEEFAQIMYDNLTSQGPEWEPHLIFVIIVDTTGETQQIAITCLYVEDNEEYTNWIMQGYFDVYDWKLGQEWYDTDFSTTDGAAYGEMMDTLITDIDTMLNQYIKDNDFGIIEETDESQEALNEAIEDALGQVNETPEVTE